MSWARHCFGAPGNWPSSVLTAHITFQRGRAAKREEQGLDQIPSAGKNTGRPSHLFGMSVFIFCKGTPPLHLQTEVTCRLSLRSLAGLFILREHLVT